VYCRCEVVGGVGGCCGCLVGSGLVVTTMYFVLKNGFCLNGVGIGGRDLSCVMLRCVVMSGFSRSL
jgi:hypothetical protein